MKLYLEISDDEYGLPIVVADHPREIEEINGLSKGTVCQSISRAIKNNEWCRFIRVDTDGEYEEAEWKPKKDKSISAYKNEKKVCSYRSVREAAEITGKSRIALYNCLEGRTKSCGGFIWRYDE